MRELCGVKHTAFLAVSTSGGGVSFLWPEPISYLLSIAVISYSVFYVPIGFRPLKQKFLCSYSSEVLEEWR
jgi:hypothetical protein